MPPVLAVENLTVSLKGSHDAVAVLENLSFSVEAGETLALVGESGCGKSITALAIMGLLPNGFRRETGRILLGGEDVSAAAPARLRALRGSSMSMIFQEPMTALNPLYTIGDQIAEALRLHQNFGRQAALARAVALLEAVQIPEAGRRLAAYPHELSGGMRQRVMIAMALACRPALLIADEPTTALDVTVQAQVFDLLQALQAEMRMAIVLITHDLGAVADIANRVAVLYAGRCVERGKTAAILRTPQHHYTRGLMASVPTLRLGLAASRPSGLLPEIGGMVPPLGERPAICAFAARCPRVDDVCRSHLQPPLSGIPDAMQDVACFHPQGRAA